MTIKGKIEGLRMIAFKFSTLQGAWGRTDAQIKDLGAEPRALADGGDTRGMGKMVTGV